MDDAARFFWKQVEEHLGITFVGLQSGHGHGPDLILFEGFRVEQPESPLHGKCSTLCIPFQIIYEPQEVALALIAAKRKAVAPRNSNGQAAL